MKHLILALLFLLVTNPATAADFAITGYPRHGDRAEAADWLAMLEDFKAVNARGMVITKSWTDLEPTKRAYTGLEQLGKDFASNVKDGRDVFFGIQPINTTRRTLPPDLMGKDWDDAEVIGRFQELVDRLSLQGAPAPKFVSLANEADVYLGDRPKEVEKFLKFYERASAIVKQAFPGTRAGITVTYDGLVKGRGALIQKLIDASDIAIFTYYPVIDLVPQPVENVGDNLDGILKVAGEKEVLLQEVGYPSAELLGSSPKTQGVFFRNVIGAIQQREQIKFASLFILHDFSPQLCDMFVTYYGFEKAPEAPKKKFREFLCSLGMKKFDGTEKPAWVEVKKALQ